MVFLRRGETLMLLMWVHSSIILLLLSDVVVVNAWMMTTTTTTTSQAQAQAQSRRLKLNGKAENSVDVSDLGLTMEDLEAPLPAELLQGMTASGYQSTSRIPSVNDDGCQWTERADGIDAILRIPGLRGQPSACLSVIFSTTTATVAAFGRPVWSCVLQGQIQPDASTFSVEDGEDMIPTIRVSVAKADNSQPWRALYDQVGEDSLI